MASLEHEAEQLQNALQALRQHWRETQAAWDDQVSRSFENDHFTPLDKQTADFLGELNKLAQVVSNAKRSMP